MLKTEQNERDLAVLILAAGKGKRMNNPDIPKVMAELKGAPLIGHVLRNLHDTYPTEIIAIVGHHREIVIEYLQRNFNKVDTVIQYEQLGTGHAVMQAKDALADFNGNVLILSGDVPLMKTNTLLEFIEQHKTKKADISVLTAFIPDATGYGRVIRDDSGNFTKIVEHKDATEEERSIREINSGIYCVDSVKLFESLAKVNNNNAQGEYYLTDIIALLHNSGNNVTATVCNDYREILGINTAEELVNAEALYSQLYANV